MFDGIFDSLKETLIEAIISIASGMDFIEQGIADPLSQNAGEYSQSALTLVMNVAENVVLPVAGVIFTYVVVNDLIEMLTAHNNMHEHTTQDLYKWLIKTAIGVMLISNAFTIANSIIEVGATMVEQALPYTSSEEVVLGTVETGEALMELGLWDLMFILFALFFNLLVSIIGVALVQLFIIARFFEIYMYLSVAPIPFSTMMSGQLNHTAITYIKNLIGVAIQGLLILLSFSIYTAISTTYASDIIVGSGISGGALSVGNFFWTAAQGLVLILVLVVMVWRSRSIAKDIVGS